MQFLTEGVQTVECLGISRKIIHIYNTKLFIWLDIFGYRDILMRTTSRHDYKALANTQITKFGSFSFSEKDCQRN